MLHQEILFIIFTGKIFMGEADRKCYFKGAWGIVFVGGQGSVETVFLCSLGYPETHYVDLAGFELSSKTRTTMPIKS